MCYTGARDLAVLKYLDFIADDWTYEQPRQNKEILLTKSDFEERIAKVKKEILSGEPIIDTIKKALFGE